MPEAGSDEEGWIQEQRRRVEAYLARQGCDHLRVGDCPAFYVHPYLALWAVQSKRSPGAVGWWAISGDSPTDYVSGSEAGNPREAVGAFSRRWRELSDCMLRGEAHPDCSWGPPDRQAEFGDLLKRRAEILQEYADWEILWDEDGGPVFDPGEEPDAQAG